jgi:ZIP family zinc transporter
VPATVHVKRDAEIPLSPPASPAPTPEAASNATPKTGFGTIALLVAPLVLLIGVIALFVSTSGAGLNVAPAAPIETIQFARTVLRPGQIELHLRNTSPEPITLAQINVNDAIWPFAISPDRTIPRLGSAVVTLAYPWIEGEAYDIALLSSNSIPFSASIAVASTTRQASAGTLWSFTLIGLYVGILPVLLGMLWLPALRRVGPAVLAFATAATVGLLLYLGFDAAAEALEIAGTLSATYQGVGIVGIGFVGTWLLLDAIARRQRSVGQSEAGQRQSLATVIAVGIGLHNLGEGLAIGAAYAVGEAALGTFLVVGFIIQNITEGFGIIVPVARDKPSLRSLALLGLIGGGPAIAGAWIGGLVHSQPMSVLFLAIGAGAVFQVAYKIGRELVWKGTPERQRPLAAFAGVLTGMLVLYMTGVVIK